MEFTMEFMTSVFADTTSNQRKPCKSSDQQIALHLRYAKIGIAAVAAAARYQSGAKNPGLSLAGVEVQSRGDATA
jgi:hypothetical protein